MTLKDLRSIIEDRFLDIITEILELSPNKLRLILKDKSFILVARKNGGFFQGRQKFGRK